VVRVMIITATAARFQRDTIQIGFGFRLLVVLAHFPFSPRLATYTL
jgi:hypothetical protein